jgi:mRNA-degrading endonuclease RelE of RelBE toxin-antitoxin system
MRFIELGNYTKQVCALMSDSSYKALQNHLVLNPKSGKFYPGSKYLRKIRWGDEKQGKRGGTRHIYYFYDSCNTFFMLYAYGKNDKEDITKKELKIIDKMVEQLTKEYGGSTDV